MVSSPGTRVVIRALRWPVGTHIIIVLVRWDVDVHDGELVRHCPVNVLDHFVDLATSKLKARDTGNRR